MSLSNTQLDAFLAISQSRSFSEAATRLGVTQSALTQRIQNLESELEATLLIRDPAGPKLTESGQRLLRYCLNRASLESEAVEQLKTKSGQIAGTLRIGSFSTFTRSRLLPLLKQFRNKHPHVHFEVLTRETFELSTMLRQGQCEYIVTLEKPIRDDIEFVELEPEINVLVEAKSGIDTDIYLDHDENDTSTFDFWKLQNKKPSVLLRNYFDEMYTILDAVEAGLGKAVAPKHLIENRKNLKIVGGLKPMITPVYFCFFKQAFYSELHKKWVEWVSKNV